MRTICVNNYCSASGCVASTVTLPVRPWANGGFSAVISAELRADSGEPVFPGAAADFRVSTEHNIHCDITISNVKEGERQLLDCFVAVPNTFESEYRFSLEPVTEAERFGHISVVIPATPNRKWSYDAHAAEGVFFSVNGSRKVPQAGFQPVFSRFGHYSAAGDACGCVGRGICIVKQAFKL